MIAPIAPVRPNDIGNRQWEEKHELPGQRRKHRSVFQSSSGKLAEFTASFAACIEKPKGEELNLCHALTVDGDEVFCREAYAGAAGTLAHRSNVGPQLIEVMTIADLDRLRGPLAPFKAK